jgi:hypothetical protein
VSVVLGGHFSKTTVEGLTLLSLSALRCQQISCKAPHWFDPSVIYNLIFVLACLLCFFKGPIICANTRAAVARKEGEGERASGKEWEKKVADCEGEKEKETRQGKSEEGNREKLRTQSGGETGQKSRGNTEKGTLREQRGLQREKLRTNPKGKKAGKEREKRAKGTESEGNKGTERAKGTQRDKLRTHPKMKEKAKGTERAERAKTRTRQHEKVEREQVSKGNAEGAVTDRRKMEEKVKRARGTQRDNSRTVEK